MSKFWSGVASTTFDEWAQKRIAALEQIKPAAHIHIIGICGTGTGALLQLLVDLGFRVTGSDKAFYPPMGNIVRAKAAAVFEGYSQDSFVEKPDFVVIGNTASASNPEVEYVLEHEIPFCSLDEALRVFLIGTQSHCPNAVVVAGTHGKTTTTSLLTWIFESAGRAPSYFIGGVSENFKQTVRAQDARTAVDKRVCILEGDEYNSSFFSRYSKFHAYRPDVLIVTSLEFDHADIFSSIEDIELQFERLVASMPASGRVFVSSAYPSLRRLSQQWRAAGYCGGSIYQYGQSDNQSGTKDETPYASLVERTPRKDGMQEIRCIVAGKECEFELPLSGPHNAENALVAAAVAHSLGVSLNEVSEALRTFSGVKRRQQVIYNEAGITVVEDFAHHPTAVEKTLQGIREAIQPRRLVVAFDPRSNTSKRHYFQQQYAQVFDAADVLFLKQSDPPGSFSLTGEIRPLDIKQLATDIGKRGPQAEVCADSEEILTKMLAFLRDGDCAVLMSNGSFEGLPQKLPEALRRRDF